MNDAVLELVRYGFTVFPLQPKSKVPYPESWLALQCKSEEEVRQKLAPRFAANSNHAVAMGRASGIIGLDIDYDDGADPELLKRLPVSWTAKSGKGHHVFYKYPAHWPELGLGRLVMGKTKDKNGKLKACVSLRGNGHYFVGVGSIHPETGARYEWAKYEGWDDKVSADLLCPEELGALQDAPDFLLDAIGAEEERKREPGEKYHENERHAMFVATATAMRKEGHIESEIYGRLVERNREDCLPPKENAEKELRNVAKWACVSVTPDGPRRQTPSPEKAPPPAEVGATTSKTEEQNCTLRLLEGIRPLGHLDNDYFYLSESNQQITRISSGSHGSTALLNLMPYQWWVDRFWVGRGIDWTRAAGVMMAAGRAKGIFNAKRIRGECSWNGDKGEHVVHHGNRISVDGTEFGLLDRESRYTYRLGPDLPSLAPVGATIDECKALLYACEAPAWVRPESAMLFAGSLSLLRICGFLTWRPHVWLTGAAGSGKTTLMSAVVSKIVGEWGCYVLGDTSSAGIRQKLGCASKPVIFDESEGDGKRGQGRIQGILELARQASSDSEGTIVKGTPSGNALEFKVNSSFFLSSIRVGLTQEADLSRFAVLELGRPPVDTASQEGFKRSVGAVTAEFGDKLHRRMVDMSRVLVGNYELLQRVIAEKSTPRHGQQYGMLLAGYACLASDAALSLAEAEQLVGRSSVLSTSMQEHAPISDEIECLNHLSRSMARIAISTDEVAKDYSFRHLVEAAQNKDVNQLIQVLGIRVRGQEVIVANTHPVLAKVFAGTKWDGTWWRALQRVAGARRVWARFDKGSPDRATSVPISLITSDEVDVDDDPPF